MTISKGGEPVVDLDDWKVRGGPKRESQWQEGRSAMELARCWLDARPCLPGEVSAVLAAHPAFGTIDHWVAEPEARLPLDALPGEPRNADLAVYARDEFGDFVMTIEAKADESFGDTVAATLAASIERKLKNQPSNAIQRVEQLARAVFGARQRLGELVRGHRERYEPFLGNLRYQLLTATAGTLREAEKRGVSRAVLLVQEFRTNRTDDAKHAENATDLNGFITRLSHGRILKVEPGMLCGPFTIPGAPLFVAPPPALFIGKAQRNLRLPE